MVSRIEPDRYADTGFSVKDTSPEVNAVLFDRMMRRPPGDRLKMSLEMTATAKAFVRASLPDHLDEVQRRSAFLERFYGSSLDLPTREAVARGLPASRNEKAPRPDPGGR